jgi:hypothetical protein
MLHGRLVSLTDTGCLVLASVGIRYSIANKEEEKDGYEMSGYSESVRLMAGPQRKRQDSPPQGCARCVVSPFFQAMTLVLKCVCQHIGLALMRSSARPQLHRNWDGILRLLSR